MDSKAECDQLNLARVARTNMRKKKLKQTNASARSVFGSATLEVHLVYWLISSRK